MGQKVWKTKSGKEENSRMAYQVTRTDMGVAPGWWEKGWGGTERRLTRGLAGYLGGWSAVQGGWPAAQVVGLRQPPYSLAEARWVLANFRGLFELIRGPIFNPKEAETQVRYIMSQTKKIWRKTGLWFDRSEFLKFDSWKRLKSEKRWPKNGMTVLFFTNSQVELLGIMFRHRAIVFRRPKIIASQNGVSTDENARLGNKMGFLE